MSAAEASVLPHGEFFISYSHKDIDFATQLERDIAAEGREVWRDQVRLKPGDDFEEQIRGRLASIKTVLVILSPDALKADWVKGEVNFGLAMGKGVIPIAHRCDIRDAPIRWQSRLQVDARYGQYKAALHAILTDKGQVRGSWLARLFIAFGVAAPIATLAALIAIAVFLAIFWPLPSKTSVEVVDRGAEKIGLRLENWRLWRSTVTGPYVLRFPTLPIETAALDPLNPEKSKVGPFSTLEVGLTCPRGLKPIPMQPARAIAARLKGGDEAFLGYNVRESNQTKPVRYEIPIPSSTIRSSLIPCIAEIVKMRGAHAK
jgi:hypothetical protein